MAGLQGDPFRDAFHAIAGTTTGPQRRTGRPPRETAPSRREKPMPENKTTKPMSHVLVVSADPAWRDEVVVGINAAAQKLDNPFDLLAVPAANAAAAVAA